MELKCGGQLLDRHEPPFSRRFVVYFRTALYTNALGPGYSRDLRPSERRFLVHIVDYGEALPPAAPVLQLARNAR
jgi:hypothetical protein